MARGRRRTGGGARRRRAHLLFMDTMSDMEMDSDTARDYVDNVLQQELQDIRVCDDIVEQYNTDAKVSNVHAGDKGVGPRTAQILKWAARSHYMHSFIEECQQLLRNITQDEGGSERMFEFKPRNDKYRLVAHRLAERIGAQSQSIGDAMQRHVLVKCAARTVDVPSFERALLSVLNDVFSRQHGRKPPIPRPANVYKGKSIKNRHRQGEWRITGSSFLHVDFSPQPNTLQHLSSSSSDEDVSTRKLPPPRTDRKVSNLRRRAGLLLQYTHPDMGMDPALYSTGRASTMLQDSSEESSDEVRKSNKTRQSRTLCTRNASPRNDTKNSLYGKPISNSNKGFTMLQNMGWSQGQGLGVDEHGRKEPLDVKLRISRKGLGQ